MKIRIIIFAVLFIFAAACKSGTDHGHEHNGTEEHSHGDETHAHPHEEGDEHAQEEFTMEGDTLKTKADSTHTHDDGTVHENH